jgi:PhnB protein
MPINPYISFNSNCEAAFKYYEKHLGAKIDAIMRNGEAPADMKMPPDRAKYVMHGQISIDGTVLMGADMPPDRFKQPQGYTVSLQVKDLADAERKFNALADGGSVHMPFGKTFFSKGFGMCVDQFGIPWMVNSPLEGM